MNRRNLIPTSKALEVVSADDVKPIEMLLEYLQELQVALTEFEMLDNIHPLLQTNYQEASFRCSPYQFEHSLKVLLKVLRETIKGFQGVRSGRVPLSVNELMLLFTGIGSRFGFTYLLTMRPSGRLVSYNILLRVLPPLDWTQNVSLLVHIGLT